MSNPFISIKDSSIWQNAASYEAIHKKDSMLRIGIVKRAYYDSAISDTKYIVEVQDRNDSIEVNAKYLRSFGGVFNYEDQIYRGYKTNDIAEPVKTFEARAGDTVLVGFLHGEAREAIIIGSLMHPARESTLDHKKGPQLKSEFNGIETHINELGEYRLTFKALPTNINKLEDISRSKIPKPQYDTKIGSSYLLLDKTGSIEVNDNSKEGLQNIKIDKPNGTILINSGKVNITISKKTEKINVKSKLLEIVSDDKIKQTTKEYQLDSTKSVKIKSPKVAIGANGTELLDQIFQLIEALSQVTPISPTGPCTTLMSTPQWSKVKQIQNKIKEITGSL